MTGSKPLRARPARPAVEPLEQRLALYSASGYAWPAPQLITLSFMPDGTNLGGVYSNLNAVFNGRPILNQPGTGWQSIILKAAQTWAAATNINFAVVPDNGAPTGAAGDQQGDPNFGDIRVGGYNFGSSTTALARAFMPPPVNNYSIAGDIMFNTGVSYSVNQTYDLFTVAEHEIGHALGLYHSSTAQAVMYPTYNGVKPGLNADDVAGIRSVYSNGAPRSPDAFDAAAPNDTLATASDITSSINTSSLTTVLRGLDVTTASDLDYYKFTAPAGSAGTMNVTVSSAGLSLLSPLVQVYDASGNLLAKDAASGMGASMTLAVSGVVPGHTYYVEVTGTESTVKGTGAYALALNLAGGPTPAIPLPNTALPAGNPLSSGGGQALVDGGRHGRFVAVAQNAPRHPHGAARHASRRAAQSARAHAASDLLTTTAYWQHQALATTERQRNASHAPSR